MEEKNKEDGVQITETTYKNSTDRILLSTLWHAGFITSASTEAITENDIKACIEDKFVIPDENIVMSTVEAAVKDVSTKTKVQPAESRIWTRVLDYCRALENAGYAELVTKRLKRLREKKAAEAKKAMGFGKTQNHNVGHSTLFSAAFCRSAVETTVLADGGGDDNLLPRSLLRRITKVDSTVSTITLTSPETFRQIGSGTQPLTCSRRVEVDVELRIRHVSKLLLRKVTWKVVEEEIEYVILGRPLLEALG